MKSSITWSRFRGAVRQSNWKLVWRTLLPSHVELFNIAQDPSEKNNFAAQHPDKVAAFQQRLDELAKQSEKPLLVDQFEVVTKGLHGKPILPLTKTSPGSKLPSQPADKF